MSGKSYRPPQMSKGVEDSKPRRSKPGPRPSALSPQPSPLSTQDSGLSTQHSALSTQRYRWTILALVTEGQSLAALVGLCLMPLAPFFQAEFDLSRAQVGLLISALYVGAVLSSMPSGWLTDAIGSRAMLALSQVVIGAGILLVSRAGSFLQAAAVMPLVGLGYGGINPMSSKAVMLWFPGRNLGTAMSIKQTGFPVGGALGAAILPGLALA
ncbi:MAG: MFS transporter, partial [Chloroflexi bacterium]|nr:MFS transporter [Chloroflexota bacterium]